VGMQGVIHAWMKSWGQVFSSSGDACWNNSTGYNIVKAKRVNVKPELFFYEADTDRVTVITSPIRRWRILLYVYLESNFRTLY
jgi:hypothetical protein